MENSLTWPFLASTAKPYIKVVACPKKELMEFLASVKNPYINPLPCPEKELDEFLASKPEDIFIGVVDGTKSTNKKCFLAQVAKAFEFPDYFGMNWDAFEDCITDFMWIFSRQFMMVITDAENFLTKKPFFQRKPRYGKPEDDLKIFHSIMEQALADWNEKYKVSFHMILHCEPEQETKLLARLQEAGFKL